MYDGATDPMVIWNREEKSWWMLYTQRRANAAGPGFGWVHGSDIGIASSVDGGQSWLYRGVLRGLEFEPGRNTFWAPEILWHEGVYDMYVSYVRGVPQAWVGDRNIIHYSSANLWDWHFDAVLELSSKKVIDACVHRLPDGNWRMWYKDEQNDAHTWAADSRDLTHWQVVGPAVTNCPHEGPNVFFWKGTYWMLTDPWHGLGVYRSSDCESWTPQAAILDKPGSRPDDGAVGHHADVLVQGEEAYVFYFVHPHEFKYGEGAPAEHEMYSYRRSSVQVARLELQGEQLICNRDQAFPFELISPGD